LPDIFFSNILFSWQREEVSSLKHNVSQLAGLMATWKTKMMLTGRLIGEQ